MIKNRLWNPTTVIVVLLIWSFSSPVAASSYDLDQYGGWMDYQLEATGFFRLDSLGGRPWLITPEGHPYFYLGLNKAMLSGYLLMCRDQFKTVYHSSKEEWLDDVNSIREEAGFNGWGTECDINMERRAEMWSDTRFYTMSDVPFTPIIYFCHNWAHGDLLRDDGYNVPSERFPDVFSPEWEEQSDYRAETVCTRLVNNRNVIGYFITSEPDFRLKPRSYWVERLISLEPGEPGKMAFQACMESLYTSIEDFNDAYRDSLGYDLSDFNDMQYIESLRLNYNDRKAFLLKIIEKFYHTAREKIEKYDPNHLFLGARLNELYTCPPAIDKAAELTDVLSFIRYSNKPDIKHWRELSERYGKPMLHVSFCYMGEDTGYDNTPDITVPTQFDRGISYENLVKAETGFPLIIGISWYSFYDHGDIWQNWGLVDPLRTYVYKDMTDIMAEINSRIYDLAMNYDRSFKKVSTYKRIK